jgi:hypothetical protein
MNASLMDKTNALWKQETCKITVSHTNILVLSTMRRIRNNIFDVNNKISVNSWDQYHDHVFFFK